MERYEAAASLLEKIDDLTDAGSFWDFWGQLYRLAIAGRNLWASGARCDRREGEARSPLIADAGDKEFTIAITMAEFPFKRAIDSERLIAGLRKAGVPDLGNREPAKPNIAVDRSGSQGADLRARRRRTRDCER